MYYTPNFHLLTPLTGSVLSHSPLHPHITSLPPPTSHLHRTPHQAIIYKLIRFPRLSALLANEHIQSALQPRRSLNYKDVDPLFDHEATIIDDYGDSGILKRLFITVYHQFIEYCVRQQNGLQVGEAEPLQVGGVGGGAEPLLQVDGVGGGARLLQVGGVNHCRWVGLDHCRWVECSNYHEDQK